MTQAEFIAMIARMDKPDFDADDGMPDDDELCDSFSTLMELIDLARAFETVTAAAFLKLSPDQPAA